MDVFQFDSPPQPLLRGAEEALKWRDKPSTKRRKVYSIMNDSPFFAHVVRISEPSVTANELLSAPVHYLESLLEAGYLPSSLTCPSTVPSNNTASVAKPGEDTAASEQAADSDSILPQVSRSSARAPSADHPRPESSDLWEEEDRRRMRFALPDGGDDHVERLGRPHRGAPGADQSHSPGIFYSPELAISLEEHQRASVQTLGRNSEAPEVIFDPIPTGYPFHAALESFLPPPPSMPLFTASQFVWDDNSLPVDDHRRTYDFADFMDQWSQAGQSNEALSAFTPPFGPSLWRRTLQEYIRTATDEVDMQGLRWNSMGSGRKSALRAREALHPQRPDERAWQGWNTDDDHGRHYQFRSFAPKHRARFSHYQLRNMIAAGKGRNVYYAAENKVKTASLSCSSVENTVMDLAKPSRSATPFKITCLTTSSSAKPGDGILLAGGFNGEFAMLSLDAPSPTKPVEGTVSYDRDGIVNHISTFYDRRSGIARATFCSNDRNVRVMDLSQLRIVDAFTYDNATNGSTMSPDSRLRAFVHDGNDIIITNADTGEVLFGLEAHTDYAFACDWSPCGRYLGTGAEDAQVVVWDSRNWKRPLHHLPSVMSCARSSHFTDDSALVVAESEDVVSIVDTANFDVRQDTRFFGAIAGIALLGGGAEMVVANSDETVGGLMSFQRLSRGHGNGEFGQQVEYRSQRPPDYESAIVDVMI